MTQVTFIPFRKLNEFIPTLNNTVSQSFTNYTMCSNHRKPEFVDYIANALTVDLYQSDGHKRWQTVINKDVETAATLVRNAWNDFPRPIQWLANCGLAGLFGNFYRSSGSPYQ